MKIVFKIALVSSLLIISCGGRDDSSGGEEPQPVAAPKATTLIFPANNTECNEGTVIDANKNSVNFQWNPAENADSYTINIKNLNNNQTSITAVNGEETRIVINRGTPYEWFVTSKAKGTDVTADSQKFKFYNQGPGIENYAPFPAEVVNPARGAVLTNSSGTVNLQWKGTDIDADISEYEVFFGTSETPTESLGSTTEDNINAAVTVGSTYYWTVLTTDTHGSTSLSEVFEFKISS